ncbi:hypothetical protein BI350_02930 [Sporosarcina ureilytica]|uniref:Translation initiation factor 2 n=1 Tax=Sporosarcina ureilytica TaxID=298596 RepID=A0A1D8JD78_9BACL|nr:hypothetical protein BI350_02930 [Sporosarcina ureilytica]
MGPFNEQDENNQLSFSERIGLLGAVLVAIGDALALASVAAAIDEDRQSNQEQTQQIENLQKQIDELKNEISKGQGLPDAETK